jgi:hypothetical protein
MGKPNYIYTKLIFATFIGVALFFIAIQQSCFTDKFNLKATNAKQSFAISIDNIKHKGAHVFGYLDSMNVRPILEHNFDWITIVPYGAQKGVGSSEMVHFSGDSLDRVKRDSMWASQIDIAHEFGFKVFIKPHLWINNAEEGKWRSDIYPTNGKNWKKWQASYRDYILDYANIAEKNNVELYCIGAEFTRLTKEKPEFWRELIQDVRGIYSGQITYAANWYDEYDSIEFWKELDYIGIQAYFPLSKVKKPSVKQISDGWNKYLPKIEALHKEYNRKVLFTEMGYKSTAHSAVKPWEWVENSPKHDHSVCNQTQANCYEAFFNKIWDNDWFAGVHIWQLRSDFNKNEYSYSLDFTPQGKPAFMTIAEGFK